MSLVIPPLIPSPTHRFLFHPNVAIFKGSTSGHHVRRSDDAPIWCQVVGELVHSDKQQTEYNEQMAAYQQAISAQYAAGQGLGDGLGSGPTVIPQPPPDLSTVKKQYRHVLCLYCTGG